MCGERRKEKEYFLFSLLIRVSFFGMQNKNSAQKDFFPPPKTDVLNFRLLVTIHGCLNLKKTPFFSKVGQLLSLKKNCALEFPLFLQQGRKKSLFSGFIFAAEFGNFFHENIIFPFCPRPLYVVNPFGSALLLLYIHLLEFVHPFFLSFPNFGVAYRILGFIVCKLHVQFLSVWRVECTRILSRHPNRPTDGKRGEKEERERRRGRPHGRSVGRSGSLTE